MLKHLIVLTLTLFAFCSSNAQQYKAIIKTVYPNNSVITPTCNSSFSFEADSSNNQKKAKYKWDFGDGTPSVNGITVSHNYVIYGNVIQNCKVTLTVLDSLGNFQNSATTNVSFKQKPDPSVSVAGYGKLKNNVYATCGKATSDTITLSNTSKTILINKNYSINWGDGTPIWKDTIFNSLSHIYKNQGYYSILITVEGKNTCSSIETINYYLGSNPASVSANFGTGAPTNDPACTPYKLVITFDNQQNNSLGTTYIVKLGDGTILKYLNNDLPKLLTHEYTKSTCDSSLTGVPVRIQTENGCGFLGFNAQLSVPLFFSSKPKPVIKPSISNNYCVDKQLIFNTTFTEGYDAGNGCKKVVSSSKWTITPNTYVSGSLTNDNLSIKFQKAGDYKITYEASNDCGPQDTFFNVTIKELPKADASVDKMKICENDAIKTTNKSTNQTSNLWELTPKTGFQFVNGTNANSLNPEIKFTVAGIYSLKLTVKNDCATDVATPITIEVLAKPTFNFTFNASDCDPITVKELTDNIKNITGSVDNIIIESTTTGKKTLILNEKLGSVTFNNSDVITVTFEGLCGTFKQIGTVTIAPKQTLTITNKPTASILCSDNLPTKIQGSSTNGIWVINNIQQGTGTSINFPQLGANENEKDFKVLYKGSKCDNADSFFIKIYKKPNFDIKNPLNSSYCDKVTLDLNDYFSFGGKYDSIVWKTNNMGIIKDIKKVVFSTSDVITATMYSFCGNLTQKVNVNIGGLVKIKIIPIKDTLCSSVKQIIMKSNYKGAKFKVNGVLLNDSIFIFPSQSTAVYTIIAEGDANSCTISDMFKLTVLGNKKLKLKQQKDECKEFSYNGDLEDPTLLNVTYTIDGIAQTTFPIILKGRPLKYVVIATYKDFCGEQKDTILFNVFPIVKITMSSIKDTLCSSEQQIILKSDYKGSIFEVDGKELKDSIFVFPNQNTATYTIVAKGGLNSCTISDMFKLTVLGNKKLEMMPQTDSCDVLKFKPKLKDATLQNVTYTVNGKVENKFPMTLKGNPLSYVVIATYKDFCGEQKDTILFNVFQIVKIKIDQKVPTEICISNGNVILKSDNPGVVWFVNGIKQDSVFDISKAKVGKNIIIARDTIGCTTPDTIIINVVNDKVKINPVSPVCITAASIPLSTLPNYNAGIWTGKGIDASTGVFSPIIANKGIYQINYNYKIPNTACEARDSVKIEVVALEDSFYVKKCNGFEITFGLIKNSKVDSLIWNFGDGQKSTQNAASVLHTYAMVGNYSTTLKCFLGECDTTLYLNITVEEQAIAKFEMDTLICEDQILPIENKSQGTNLTYNWLVGDKVVGTGINFPNNIKFSVNQDSIVTITLEIKNGCGANTISKSLKIKAKPNVRFGSILQEYCSGAKFYIKNTSSGATDYKWYLDGILISSNAQLDSLVLLTGKSSTTYTYTLVASNYCGSDTITKKFNIKPTDVKASFTINKKTICVGEDLQITNNATKNAIVKYALGNGTFVKQETFKFSYQAAGKYRIVQYVYGCGFDSTFTEITVLALPKVEVVAKPNCLKLLTEVTTKTNGISVAHTLENGDTTNAFDFKYLYKISGKFNIKTIATSQNGCKATLITPIEIYPLPNEIYTLDTVACENAPVMLSTNTKVSVVFHSGDGNVSDLKTTAFKYIKRGLYKPYAIFIDNNTCRDTIIKSVFINPTPTAGFEVPTVNLCPPVDLKITDNSIDATSFNYSITNGLYSNATSPSFKFIQGGDFMITQYVNNQTCADTLIKSFHIFSVPDVGIEIVQPKCFDKFDAVVQVKTKSFTDLITLEGKSLKYKQSGVNRFEGLKPGDYMLTVKSIDGCMTFQNLKIFKPDSIKLSISNRDTIYISYGGTDTLVVKKNKDGLKPIWDSTVGHIETIITKNSYKVVIAPPTDILYYLTVVDSFGCKATSKVWVIIDKRYKIYIPTVFSSNEDGINDNFTVFAELKNVEIVKEMKIFNRWGNEVFSNRNFMPDIEAEGWNGTYRGEPAETGVYAYKISILFKDGTTHDFKGDVQLIR